MIVKVAVDDKKQYALITNEDSSISMQVPASQVSRRLNGKKSGFFSATMEPGGILELGDPEPAQSW